MFSSPPFLFTSVQLKGPINNGSPDPSPQTSLSPHPCSFEVEKNEEKKGEVCCIHEEWVEDEPIFLWAEVISLVFNAPYVIYFHLRSIIKEICYLTIKKLNWSNCIMSYLNHAMLQRFALYDIKRAILYLNCFDRFFKLQKIPEL